MEPARANLRIPKKPLKLVPFLIGWGIMHMTGLQMMIKMSQIIIIIYLRSAYMDELYKVNDS